MHWVWSTQGKKWHIYWVPLSSPRLCEITFRFIEWSDIDHDVGPLHTQENVLSPRQGFCCITVIPAKIDEENDFRPIWFTAAFPAGRRRGSSQRQCYVETTPLSLKTVARYVPMVKIGPSKLKPTQNTESGELVPTIGLCWILLIVDIIDFW